MAFLIEALLVGALVGASLKNTVFKGEETQFI